MIRKAKNDWGLAKATEIERGSFGGVEKYGEELET